LSADECWGIFREREHSPGRESDDAEILRLTAKSLEARGFQVLLKSAEEVLDTSEAPARGVFLMCEQPPILEHLRWLESRGIPHVNSPLGVLNTYRERMVAQLAEAGLPFIASRLVSTTEQPGDGASSLPVWVKRGDVHNTQDGDVAFAETDARVRWALEALAARGITRAVIQPHVAGDLVKFYGIGVSGGSDGAPPWFRWFYHKAQRVAGYAFDHTALARTVRAAAVALGLDVYGGDAIVMPSGELVLLDVNAWPSFALYRDEAAEVIAAHLALRFTGAAR
jgi:hypothetical protein